MTRADCETRIFYGLQDIWDDYVKYNPNGKYLSLSIMAENGRVVLQANNECWEHDENDMHGNDYDAPVRFCRVAD